MSDQNTLTENVAAKANQSMSGPWIVSPTLGWYSSHPRYSTSRLVILFSFALIPWFISLCMVLFFLTLDADESSIWLNNYGRQMLLWGLVTAGFAAGLGLTGALSSLGSRSKKLVEDRGTPNIGLWGGFILLFVLGSLPWLVPTLFDAGPRIRAACAVLGIIPMVLVVVLVLLVPSEDANGRPQTARIRWWTLIFPLAILGVIAWIRFGGYCVQIAEWGPMRKILSKVFGASTTGEVAKWPIEIDAAARDWVVIGLVALFLSPLLVVSFLVILWLRDLAVGNSYERRIRKRPTVRERVKGHALMGEGQTRDRYRRRKLGFNRETWTTPEKSDAEAKSEIPEKRDSVDQPPAWVGQLQKVVDAEKKFGDWEPKRFAVGETAPVYVGKESFEEFFDNVTPSTDQVRAFTAIYDYSSKRFTAEHESKPAWDVPTADVVIQGTPGSGRTATAVASIVQSIIVRGETVLVIVPNAIKRRSMIRRIRRAAESSGVGWFINVGDLTERGVQPWAEPNDEAAGASSTSAPRADGNESFAETRDRLDRKKECERLERSTVHPKSTPDVLVGTLSDFEARFFSGSSNFTRLSAVIRRIELVVVDDVDIFDVSDRIHLRFMLDKLRLIVGSHGLGCRTLLITPSMSDSSRDFVAEQLLTSKERIETLKLRSFARAPGAAEPWEVELKATKPGSAGVSNLIELCAKSCIAKGVEVVVFSPRMNSRERRELESTLEGAGEAEVRVVADLDELDSQDASQFGAVFYSAVSGMGASMAIRSHAGSEETVVFTILPLRVKALDRPVLHQLLVLPDGRARALFAIHLRSATRFLRRLQPIHRSLWSKLGLPESGSLREDLNSADNRIGNRLEDRQIILDPSDPVSAQRTRLDVWGWCCLADEGGGTDTQEPRPMPVAIRDMIESGASIQVEPGAGRFLIAMVHDDVAGIHGVAERRVAEWFSEDRQSIGKEDLAYSANLRFEANESGFFPAAFEERDGRDRGAIRIEGALWSERGDSSNHQSYMLVLRLLELNIADDLCHKPSMLTTMPKQVNLIETSHKPSEASVETETSDESGESAVVVRSRQFATIEVAATFDESALVRKQSLKMRFEASTCFLVFNFSQAELESDAIQRDLGGDWGYSSVSKSTSRTIVPELGAAFTIAMRRHAPGMERFVRCVGLRIGDSSSSPRFALLFIEPLSTEGTAFALLSRIVRDKAMLCEFIGTAAATLQEVHKGEILPPELFVKAQACIGAVVNDEQHLEVDMKCVAVLSDLLQQIAAAGAAR